MKFHFKNIFEKFFFYDFRNGFIFEQNENLEKR